jgi:hypothetical protein
MKMERSSKKDRSSRIGDNQYENPSVFGQPCAWDRQVNGIWRQQCNHDGWLERFPDIIDLGVVPWDGEETTPERWT